MEEEAITLIGSRVVRGPDWNWRDQDGGEGYLGIIESINAGHKLAHVIWDSGDENHYRLGLLSDHDLCILDSAQAGNRHQDIKCDGCGKQDFYGLRYKCEDCNEVNLCGLCYHQNKHSLSHSFRVFSKMSDKEGRKCPRRENATRVQSFGLYPGAVVVRGPDWKRKDEDGGKGEKGRIIEVVDITNQGERHGVKVRWNHGEKGNYRVGADGSMDVKYITPAKGMLYYDKHLPVATLKSGKGGLFSLESLLGQTSGGGLFEKLARDWSELLGSGGGDDDVRAKAAYVPGDKVKLKESKYRTGHLEQPNWDGPMSKALKTVGTVMKVKDRGMGNLSCDLVFVDFDFGLDIPEDQLELVHRFVRGSKFRLDSRKEKVKLHQMGILSWDDDMADCLGDIGEVLHVGDSGFLKARIKGHVWKLNPVVCSFLEEEKPSLKQEQQQPNKIGANHSPAKDNTDGEQAMFDVYCLRCENLHPKQRKWMHMKIAELFFMVEDEVPVPSGGEN